jgi:methylglyoxal synthase
MNIALVAHDGRKKELIEWVEYNSKTLSKHNLYATGTTGRLIKDVAFGVAHYDKENDTEYTTMDFPFKDNVTCLLSGPLGGDQQIGAMIAEGKIDVLIFFCDNLIVQGHQNDVSALTRLASLYNIAFATNRTTADMILTSPLFKDPEYKRILPAAIENYKNREL